MQQQLNILFDLLTKLTLFYMTYSKLVVFLVLVALASAQQYTHQLGEDFFQFTRVSYCQEDIIRSWDCEPCSRHPKMQHIQAFYNDTDKAQGYCGYDPSQNKVIIAIRGSVNAANYLNDLDYAKVKYDRCGGCGVHKGFYETYQNLANNLLGCAYTLNSMYPSAEIWITGHSLGAAQATFAALEIKHLLGNVHALYNYGTPRVGDDAFAAYIEKELAGLFLARVVRDKDTFTHTPTQTQGFTHYGNEVFYDENMASFKICGREDKTCANKYFWPYQWKLDHHLYMYGQCSGCTQQGCENVI